MCLFMKTSSQMRSTTENQSMYDFVNISKTNIAPSANRVESAVRRRSWSTLYRELLYVGIDAVKILP